MLIISTYVHAHTVRVGTSWVTIKLLRFKDSQIRCSLGKISPILRFGKT